ncbi:MAG: hypothetical protein VB131_09785 [Burkholderia gladioli]
MTVPRRRRVPARRVLQQLAHRRGDVGIRVVGEALGDAAPERIVEEVERERLQFRKAFAVGATRARPGASSAERRGSFMSGKSRARRLDGACF